MLDTSSPPPILHVVLWTGNQRCVVDAAGKVGLGVHSIVLTFDGVALLGKVQIFLSIEN